MSLLSFDGLYVSCEDIVVCKMNNRLMSFFGKYHLWPTHNPAYSQIFIFNNEPHLTNKDLLLYDVMKITNHHQDASLSKFLKFIFSYVQHIFLFFKLIVSYSSNHFHFKMSDGFRIRLYLREHKSIIWKFLFPHDIIYFLLPNQPSYEILIYQKSYNFIFISFIYFPFMRFNIKIYDFEY